MSNSENLYLSVDGEMIKSARKTGQHDKALRVFRPGQREKRAWGATVCGELRVFRSRVTDEFRMELLRGEFNCACPTPDLRETTKHVYIQQTLRHSRLKALIVCLRKGESLYHHDIKIVGDCEVAYDRDGEGFRKMTHLWIQTQQARIIPAGPWTRVRQGASDPYLIDSLPR